jgi:hypothetical protein
MQLTLDQIGDLREILLTFLPTEDELRDFLFKQVGGRRLDRYATGPDLESIAQLLIARADKDQPQWIEEIVAAVGQVFGHEQRVQDFVAQVTPAQARRAVADPYNACFLESESRPFVDRTKLRPALKRLNDPPPNALKKPRILVVGGDPKTGKTYTKYLIAHLATKFGFEHRIVDLWSGGNDPASVGKRIADLLDLEGIPEPGSEQMARFTNTIFFDRFVGQIKADKNKWWIVLDGFGAISVSKELEEFIGRLAAKVSDSLPNVRLILLGYKHKLPSEVGRIVEEDATNEITREELAKFFEQFYAEYGPDLDATAKKTKIDEYAEELFDKMTAETPESRYETMERELTAMCEEIASA